MAKVLNASLLMACALMGALPLAVHAQLAPPSVSAPALASGPAFVSAGAAADYRVGPGDVLGISIYRAPEMSQQITVDTDGTMVFPELGRIIVADLTTAQIAESLQSRFRRAGILVNPIVSVVVTQLRAKRVSVMGNVAHPGDIALDRDGFTLSGVLALAGANFGTGDAVVTIVEGKDPAAPRSRVRIADIVSGRADHAARNGEILVVEAAPLIYVTGEVGHPGAISLEPGMTIDQALAVAGGATTRGSIHRLRLIRKLPDGSSRKIGGPRLNTRLEPDDVIFVKTRLF